MSVSLCDFSSCIGMWNLLVTPPIDHSEVMDGGGEGTRDKEENGGRYWLSVEAMEFDGGVAVGLRFCLMECERTGWNSGCQCAYIQY